MDGQMTIFDFINDNNNQSLLKIDKPIRLIELFSGIGAQAKALERLGVNFETYKTSEWEIHSCAAYHQIHMPNDNTNYSQDITDNWIRNLLFKFGISKDGKTPMSKKEIEKKNIEWCRRVYNDFIATHNLGSITNIRGEDLEIVDKDKYCYLLTYSFPCGLPGTKIKVIDGYKNIEDITSDDYVLTHTNSYKKVVKTMTRISPNYYKIKVLGQPELKLTSEHPMYVLRNGQIQWVKVKDLNINDKVCFNINTKENPIVCDNNILWLLGRYVADGHINKYSYNSINFAINFEKEKEFLNHLPKEMEGKFKKYKKKVWDYRIADKDFQELCEECGIGSCNKRIPQFILDLPKKQAKIFLDGYFSGDGHQRKDRPNNQMTMFTTTSKELFLGLQSLILKVYGTVCSCYLRHDNRKETFHDTYCGQFSNKPNLAVQTRIGNQVFTQIRNIEFVNEQTPVYNFEVEIDNSYTCENIVVHNCQDLSIAGKQKGMQKDSGNRSALLWEVERLLRECKEINTLPDILLMENVPQVHSPKFMPDFLKWIDSLEEMGYKNFWKDLNAKDYGVAQSRNRTFMISILDKNVEYVFPESIPLNKTMENYLEDNVDEKYYIDNEKSRKLINQLTERGLPLKKNGIDFSLKNAGLTPVANCIINRYDAGITNRAHEGSCVIEESRK